jgi:hypothetical protein
MRRWRRKFRSIGHAFLEVLHAEVTALLEDFQRTGRGLVRGSLFLVTAAAFAFWSLGVLTVVAIAGLALVLSLWQAAGVVFLALLITALLLAAAGRRTLRRLRGPSTIVRGHVDDHLEWWRQNLRGSALTSGGGTASGTDEDEP